MKKYRVYGITDTSAYDEYISAPSAQKAVDIFRDHHGNDSTLEVIDVAQLVKGWK